MKKNFYSLLIVCLINSNAVARFTTPGTGIKWSLDDLVANSGGAVTISDDYFVNDTIFISVNDTLSITNNATVKFATLTYFNVNGVMIVDPPTGVTFTAQNIAVGYNGVRVDFSNATVLRKLTMEYAISLRLSDCSPLIENCIFRYNNNSASTTFGNGAIAVFRSSPTINNCQFIQNQRAAIQGGSNIANAPKMTGCLFDRNNTVNANVPQINMGQSGVDTVRIINCQILGGNTNSGGIGFLPIGNVYAIIKGNTIRNNRYGLTFNGGSNINVVVSYNLVDSNNIQNDPNLGGSGISFTGGSSTSQQNSIVTGNIFRANLWGITIQGRSKANLGNLGNADTTDDGKNHFINNTNATTPFIDLYNNSVDPIFAQNNYWNTNDAVAVEAKIFHTPDNAALGLVDYSGFITIPVELINFSASPRKNEVLLNWQTASENNSAQFSIERSADGQNFYAAGNVTAAGNSNTVRTYTFTDNISFSEKIIFYRLKLVDKDGRFKYSKVLSVKMNEALRNSVKLYPNIISDNESINAAVVSDRDQRITIQFYDGKGRLLAQNYKPLTTGYNIFTLGEGTVLPKGLILVKFIGDEFHQTIKLLKQ